MVVRERKLYNKVDESSSLEAAISPKTLSYFTTLQYATQNCRQLFVDMQIFSITIFAIIVAIAYLNNMRSDTYNL